MAPGSWTTPILPGLWRPAEAPPAVTADSHPKEKDAAEPPVSDNTSTGEDDSDTSSAAQPEECEGITDDNGASRQRTRLRELVEEREDSYCSYTLGDDAEDTSQDEWTPEIDTAANTTTTSRRWNRVRKRCEDRVVVDGKKNESMNPAPGIPRVITTTVPDIMMMEQRPPPPPLSVMSLAKTVWKDIDEEQGRGRPVSRIRQSHLWMEPVNTHEEDMRDKGDVDGIPVPQYPANGHNEGETLERVHQGEADFPDGPTAAADRKAAASEVTQRVGTTKRLRPRRPRLPQKHGPWWQRLSADPLMTFLIFLSVTGVITLAVALIVTDPRSDHRTAAIDFVASTVPPTASPVSDVFVRVPSVPTAFPSVAPSLFATRAPSAAPTLPGLVDFSGATFTDRLTTYHLHLETTNVTVVELMVLSNAQVHLVPGGYIPTKFPCNHLTNETLVYNGSLDGAARMTGRNSSSLSEAGPTMWEDRTLVTVTLDDRTDTSVLVCLGVVVAASYHVFVNETKASEVGSLLATATILL
jgi:hypothetical protein